MNGNHFFVIFENPGKIEGQLGKFPKHTQKIRNFPKQIYMNSNYFNPHLLQMRIKCVWSTIKYSNSLSIEISSTKTNKKANRNLIRDQIWFRLWISRSLSCQVIKVVARWSKSICQRFLSVTSVNFVLFLIFNATRVFALMKLFSSELYSNEQIKDSLVSSETLPLPETSKKKRQGLNQNFLINKKTFNLNNSLFIFHPIKSIYLII